MLVDNLVRLVMLKAARRQREGESSAELPTPEGRAILEWTGRCVAGVLTMVLAVRAPLG